MGDCFVLVKACKAWTILLLPTALFLVLILLLLLVNAWVKYPRCILYNLWHSEITQSEQQN